MSWQLFFLARLIDHEETWKYSIYWTQARTWPTIQCGQVSNRGLDGEETHRVLEMWQRLQALQAIGDWMERKHTECWKCGKDCKHSKALMEGPQQGRSTKLLNMSRQQLSVVIGLLTGHLGLNVHLYKIGKDINPLCRRCFYGNETVNTCYVNVNP